MRFRYFDAGGSEVSLSTAAALALKIELGDVTDTTLLYDAACDEWAPAREQAIYRQILEDGLAGADAFRPESPEPDGEEAGEPPELDHGDPGQAPTAAPSYGARRPTAPPLEDFWGPAMSASGSEEDLGDVMEDFDFAAESLRDQGSPPSTGAGRTSSPRDGSSAADEPAPPSAKPPSRGARAEPPSRPDELPFPRASRTADSASVDSTPEPAGEVASEPPTPKPWQERKKVQSPRRRDPSVERLEAIARQAAASMERKERLSRVSRPTLSDRIAVEARKRGRRTGKVLKTGAVSSARALSEGGIATAETLGAGARTLAKRSLRAGRRIRTLLRTGGVRSGRAAGTLRRACGRGMRGAGRGVVALVRAVGWTARGAVRTARGVAVAVVAAVVVPARVLGASWRLLTPIRRRTRRRARRAAAGGLRALGRAALSPLALGAAVFGAVFLLFTFGGGRETGEEIWRATVGIARSVAADAGTGAAAVASAVASAAERGVAARAEDASPAAAPDPPPADGPDPGEGGVLPTPGDDPPDDVVPRPDPAGLVAFESELTLASERATQDMIAGMDSLERAYRLPEAPPEEWLGGYYLSHAREFPALRQYWARYRGYIRTVKAQDAVLYRRGLETRLGELGVPRERIAALTALGAERFAEGRARRDSLYDAMAAVAEAAVDLHDFLVDHQEQIEYDPVRSGRVSRAPVLEAYPATPEVKAEFERHLDRILERMGRVQELKPISTRDLQNVLFDSLQAVVAVDTFRLNRREILPDTGGPRPGG